MEVVAGIADMHNEKIFSVRFDGDGQVDGSDELYLSHLRCVAFGSGSATWSSSLGFSRSRRALRSLRRSVLRLFEG